MTPDPQQVAALLARLPAEDAAIVRALAEPLRETQAWRHSTRDAAIREALGLLQGSVSTQAVELARLLARYRESAWKHERGRDLPPGARDLRRLLHVILTENQGDPLAWRQLMRIAHR